MLYYLLLIILNDKWNFILLWTVLVIMIMEIMKVEVMEILIEIISKVNSNLSDYKKETAE